jgi:hypothetical protein
MEGLMLKLASALIIVVALASPISAQTKADPRAVDACKARSPTFVQVADCLPAAHVAIKTLDAFDSIYPATAQPLKAKCVERNPGNISGAWICVTEAVDKAVSLKQSLPAGASLDDPIFAAVANEDLAKKLQEAEKKAKSDFPKQTIWGGSMYFPYK